MNLENIVKIGNAIFNFLKIENLENNIVVDEYLTKEQQRRIDLVSLDRWDDNTDTMSFKDSNRWKTYKNYTHELNVWKQFFKNVFIESENECILDFGAGAAWSCVVGNKLGYDMTGLDINTEQVLDCFPMFHEINRSKVEFWDGEEMKFSDNKFSSIVSKSSITKLRKASLDITINEMVRISKDNATWYVAPYYMASRSLTNMSKENIDKIKSKNIKIVAWDYPREFKSFATEELQSKEIMSFIVENRSKFSFVYGEVIL